MRSPPLPPPLTGRDLRTMIKEAKPVRCVVSPFNPADPEMDLVLHIEDLGEGIYRVADVDFDLDLLEDGEPVFIEFPDSEWGLYPPPPSTLTVEITLELPAVWDQSNLRQVKAQIIRAGVLRQLVQLAADIADEATGGRLEDDDLQVRGSLSTRHPEV